MKEFFDKYSGMLSDKTALELMETKIQHLKEKVEKGLDYSPGLIVLHCMIEDWAKIKGIELPVKTEEE